MIPIYIYIYIPVNVGICSNTMFSVQLRSEGLLHSPIIRNTQIKDECRCLCVYLPLMYGQRIVIGKTLTRQNMELVAIYGKVC